MKVKIAYTVPENCRASANLTDMDGKFIRNLWNHRQLYANKTYTEYIDDRNDLPVGNYKLEVTGNNITTKWLGTIGNSSKIQTGPGKIRSLCQAQDWDSGTNYHYFVTNYGEQSTSCKKMPKDKMHTQLNVFPDKGMNGLHVCVKKGIVYWAGASVGVTKTYADEFAERFIDKNWTLAASCEDFSEDTYSKVKNGRYVTVGTDNKFAGYYKPEYTRAGFVQWFNQYVVKDVWCATFAGIWATKETDDSEVMFPFGRPYAPYLGMTYKSMIIYEGDLGDITGLAVSDTHIYASYGGRAWGFNSGDVIRVYTLEGRLVNEFKCPAPKKMIVVDNYLYYCSYDGVVKAAIDEEGGITNIVEWRFNGIAWSCLDVAYLALTGEIVVASTDGSIRYFDKNLIEKSVKGNLDGYWGDVEVKDDKFYWEDWRWVWECFIAIDTDGTTLIGDGGNQRIQVFDRNFTFKDSIFWISTSYHVGAMNDDPTRVFNELLEFKIDYTNPELPTGKLFRNWGYNMIADWDNMYQKIDMPFILKENGKTYARTVAIGSYQGISLVELDPMNGIIFLNEVNAGSKDKTLIYPDGCIYQDISGGGYSKVKKWQFLSVDSNGNFKWAAPVVIFNVPMTAGTTGNNMCKRYAEIWDNKFFTYNAHRDEQQTHLTRLDIITKEFINGFPSTHPNYRGEYPNDRFDIGNGTNYPGGQFVVVEGLIYCNHHGEFWKQGQTNKWHIFDSDLVALHTYGTETHTINKQGIPKPAPMFAGNSFSGNVVRVSNNMYLFHNDEGAHSGFHMVLIKYTDSIRKYTFPATVVNVSDPAQITYPLKQLPLIATLKDGDGGWNMEPAAGYDISKNDYFSVQTGMRFLSLSEPSDLSLRFRGSNKRGSVSYPIDPMNPAKWYLYGMVNYEGNYHSRGSYMANKFQIIDINDKVIFEMWPSIDYANRIVRLHMNDRVVFELAESKSEKILDYFQSFYVWCNNNLLTAKFANYNTIPLGTLQAKPAQLRILAYNTGTTNFDQQSSFIRVKFNRR